jgi:tetraacyldisaccharide 4'-kinase
MSGWNVLEGLYKGIVDIKNYLYDKEYLHSIELTIPVLSIGNLTVGGTGKTPMTDFCLKYYQRRRIRTAVISRNYRAQVKAIAQVDVSRPDAATYFGDEPVLLARRNPQCLVYVGPQKSQTAQYVAAHDDPQLVIVDDGFQHRQLYRDVDLVILDATESAGNYRCLPSGRAREPYHSLQRATALLVTKINLVSTDEISTLVSDLKRDFNKPIFCFSYEVARLCSHQGAPERRLRECAGLEALLVSGIARPETFVQGFKAFPLKIRGHRVYADHHPYSPADVQSIVAEWQKAGQPELITTEKDYVKLKALWPENVPLWWAPLEVQIKSQEDLFYEILDQVLH